MNDIDRALLLQNWRLWLREAVDDLTRFCAVAMHAHRKSLGIGPSEYARIWHLTSRQYRALEMKRLGTRRQTL